MKTTKPPESWATDANAHALKVETSTEYALLLPYDHFAFAECHTDGKEQRLRLVFTTHEVIVRGHGLPRVESAMQRMELSHLSCLHGNHLSLVNDGQPFIQDLLIKEVKESPKVVD